jgi:hypothetical protein
MVSELELLDDGCFFVGVECGVFRAVTCAKGVTGITGLGLEVKFSFGVGFCFFGGLGEFESGAKGLPSRFSLRGVEKLEPILVEVCDSFIEDERLSYGELEDCAAFRLALVLILVHGAPLS